ncbi:MAG: glycosyltransferase [Leucobacter sp.]
MLKPKRLLLLTHSLGNGGSERVTVNIANHAKRRGWDVGVIPLVLSEQDYPLDENVLVDRRVPQGGIRLIRGLRKARHVVAAVHQFKPDVVLSLDAGYGYLALAKVRSRFGLVTSPRWDPEGMLRGRPARRALYDLTFALSSRVVFQTRGAAAYFGERLRAKAAIIGNPLRDGLVHNDTPFNLRDKEIVAFGRFAPEKRFDVLIKAFAIFRKKFPEYTLSVFGRGSERERIQDLVRELQLSEIVSIEDFRADIHERIHNASMYVLSSDREGVSNSMLEAMAIGLPSACTDCPPGGARETIERYRTGELGEVGDPGSLAAAMCKIAESPERADTMIVNGRKLLEEMSGDVVCERWLQLLTDVAEGRKTRFGSNA